MVPLFVQWLIAGFVGWFLGMLSGQAFARETEARRSTFGFAGLGLLVGFLVGMSESPVVAGLVTGGFTLAGTVAGKLWESPASPKPPVVVVVGATPPHVEVPAATPPSREAAPEPVKMGWLLALCGGAMVGVVLGVATRANRTLVFREETIDARLADLGFTPAEVREIHQRWVKSIVYADLVKVATLPPSGVQAASGELSPGPEPAPTPPAVPAPTSSKFPWYQFWRDSEKANRSASDTLTALKGFKSLPPAVLEMIERAGAGGRKDEDVVKALRALTEAGSPQQ
ncbi:MAG: hypothetical protein U0835_13395 [Isosphaeraceae bacterium]